MFLTVLHSDVSLPEYISYSKDHVNLNSSKIPFWCFVREHFWANFRASSTTSLSVIIQLEIKDTNYLTCIYLCGQNKVTFKTLKSCGSCSKFMCSTHIRFILWRKRFLRGAPEVPRGGEPLVFYEEASSLQLATHTHAHLYTCEITVTNDFAMLKKARYLQIFCIPFLIS